MYFFSWKLVFIHSVQIVLKLCQISQIMYLYPGRTKFYYLFPALKVLHSFFTALQVRIRRADLTVWLNSAKLCLIKAARRTEVWSAKYLGSSSKHQNKRSTNQLGRSIKKFEWLFLLVKGHFDNEFQDSTYYKKKRLIYCNLRPFSFQQVFKRKLLANFLVQVLKIFRYHDLQPFQNKMLQKEHLSESNYDFFDSGFCFSRASCTNFETLLYFDHMLVQCNYVDLVKTR